MLVDFCYHPTNKYPTLWHDWENYIKQWFFLVVKENKNKILQVSKTYYSELKSVINQKRSEQLLIKINNSKAPWAQNIRALNYKPHIRRCFYYPPSATTKETKIFLEILTNYNKWPINQQCPGCNFQPQSTNLMYLKKHMVLTCPYTHYSRIVMLGYLLLRLAPLRKYVNNVTDLYFNN